MRKWRKNGVVAEKPKPENPCKSRKNRRRMSIYEIRYRRFAERRQEYAFNAITNAGAEVANYAFCTIEPNVGVVAVPDYRLDELAKMYSPKK